MFFYDDFLKLIVFLFNIMKNYFLLISVSKSFYYIKEPMKDNIFFYNFDKIS